MPLDIKCHDKTYDNNTVLLRDTVHQTSRGESAAAGLKNKGGNGYRIQDTETQPMEGGSFLFMTDETVFYVTVLRIITYHVFFVYVTINRVCGHFFCRATLGFIYYFKKQMPYTCPLYIGSNWVVIKNLNRSYQILKGLCILHGIYNNNSIILQYFGFWLVAAATNHIRRDWCGGLQYTLLHSHRLLVMGWQWDW